MTVSVTLPELGESVTEGTVTRWLKSEGDTVTVDEPLLEVSTDKVDTEIPSPASGVLQKIVVAEDETVDVGTELAVIAEEGEDAGGSDDSSSTSEPEQPEQADEPEQAEEPAAEPEQEQPAPAEEPEEQQAAPAAEEAPAASSDDDTSDDSGSGDDAQSSGGQSGGGAASGTEVELPELGESVTEGTVTRWLKQVGDEVSVDEPLVEVSTDKVDTEIPSPAAGTLLEIRVQEDETVDVGTVLAVIGDSSAKADLADSPVPSTEAPVESEAPADKDETPAEPEQPVDDKPEEPEQTEPEQPVREEPVQTETTAQQPSQEPTQAPAESQSQSQPAEAAQADRPQPGKSDASASTESGDSKSESREDSAAYVTPLVRKLAAEHGVDLNSLSGTGVGGRIRKQDVLDAAEKAKAPAEPAKEAAPAASESAPAAAKSASAPAKAETSGKRGTVEKLSRLRRLIATRMVESLQDAAQLTTVVEVDVTRVAQLRDRVKRDFEAREGVKLSFLPFFALAAVEALKAYPVVNSTIDLDEGTITYPAAEHLGVAVDTERGLVVPVIHNASDLNLAGLARKIADLAERTRSQKIAPDDLTGGTFTLTNTGSRGALFDTPIINQPQSAILGTGAVVKRPWVVQDEDFGEIIAVRSIVYLALSYDHRVVDGADAARFLTAMKERLEGGNFEQDLGI
ncbi:2-oxoglutarate dehydrogenase, E2 component, dihydrolipoamide succinyltransferase [Epidermidibacterium keratini]|uniref:Dihydrolipoamide acetyltransferase component of pyruvate dehydrogenase complex n=1 Tax=Epidermidibacterium keratini TaxID=1891644 RepID=A0A7L4YJD9_9ACTN|nr:2-oxoglutarate dehydrogenase, E2 component, dihydrolipoamide succinyltransferase [Epidermidibacterium keratini]QHB99221.1 2-oxoglutarate dehydrogenase, E2 component, dihydrolipoamide succinyltransferase [Epidermidibacterium keratini]